MDLRVDSPGSFEQPRQVVLRPAKTLDEALESGAPRGVRGVEPDLLKAGITRRHSRRILRRSLLLLRCLHRSHLRTGKNLPRPSGLPGS